MDGGTEWVVDAFDCSAERLRDRARVIALCGEIVARCELRVVGEPAIHVFPGPGGVTALYLLAESHLACHTFPESGVATINLYCCTPRRGPSWDLVCATHLGSTRVIVRELARGGA
ncbi:MAG TPA: S-adenosylmethionine decarboxylase [Kofleriaceae bacterium]|nr:S-adenosylmethionine decarboxylase [Kofleriaceae bacterium]